MPAQSKVKLGAMHVAWTTAIVCWSLGVVGLFWWITNYEFSNYEKPEDSAVTHWPGDAALQLSSDRPTLVFFMHPKCPCTRASLRELRRLLEASTVMDAELPDVIVVVNQPQGADAAWSNTDTVRDAALLPRATMFAEIDGQESTRFGAVTSGGVMLFDTAGKRLFAGGITTSRGHEGDSAGGVMLRQLLKNEIPGGPTTFPTFGCKLCVRGESADAESDCTGNCVAPLP
jgi:hypothetical protein